MRLIKLFLTYQLKTSQPRHKRGGFTLIELLVGLILAILIIGPLLGFVVNIMQTDRQEQAKANSEQEIQAALSYIARDLDQAVFVYDGWGVSANTRVLQNLPYATDPKYVPVLVFWKRYFYPKAIPTGAGGANCTTDPARCNDAFVYSLVTYYLIDNTDCSNPTWSCTQQIGRVEVRDAVGRDDSTTPPRYTIPDREPDPGFVLFNAQAAGSVEDQMNAWPATAPNYSGLNPPDILIDYIDQTPTTVNNVPQASCPDTPRDLPRPDAPRPIPRGYQRNPPNYPYRQVPIPTQIQRSSFYACVNSDSTSAQVFIRGNALARLNPRPNPPVFSVSRSSYFPQANILAKGGGAITTNTQNP